MKQCKVCPILDNNGCLRSLKDDKEYQVKHQYGCQTWNVVYGTLCEECGCVVYVGETERTVSERIKEHMADIRHATDKPVGNHFNGKNHSLKDFRAMVIERVCEKGKMYRQITENKWIERLGTRPEGT